MITFVSDAKIVPGKNSEAIEWMRRAAKLTNEKFPDYPVSLFTPYTGKRDHIHWVTGGYESVGDFEKLVERWSSDEEIKALMAEGRAYYTFDAEWNFFTQIDL